MRENVYKSFILPLFDYADVVWDNCAIKLADELEQLGLHLDAIRTITGTVCSASHQSLYKESGFLTYRRDAVVTKLFLIIRL